jgi:hypothetical protein
MRKICIQIKYVNRFFLATLLVCLNGFFAKADVIYATPLQGAEHQIGNLLEWSTAFEKNSHAFIVEKSMNGIDFVNAGVIDAAGSSNVDKSYRFLDLGVNDKQLFYRLKQVDTDGTSSFSQTIIVKKEMANQFMVVAMSNTLTNSTFEITIDAIEKATLEFTLKNKEGELISKNQQVLFRGLNDIQLDLKDEKEGIYFVTLRLDQEEEMLVIHKVDDPSKKKPNLASKPLKKGG